MRTAIELHLPDDLSGKAIPGHLLWKQSDPPTRITTIAEVGAYLPGDDPTQDESVMFPVNGTVEQAQAVIDEQVVPMLRAAYADFLEPVALTPETPRQKAARLAREAKARKRAEEQGQEA